MTNQTNDREEWKLNKKFIFVHEVLREFLDCVDEMNNGNYSRQPTNSIIPSTEKILDYFQSYTQKKVDEERKQILINMNNAFKVKDALNWSDKHIKLTSDGARILHMQELITKVLFGNHDLTKYCVDWSEESKAFSLHKGETK